MRLLDRSSAREQALVTKVAFAEIALSEARRQASLAADAADVPVEISKALRAPRGVDSVVEVYHRGVRIRSLLHALGRRDPAREARVWQCLRERVDRELEARAA
ncbi:hypothetical protein E1286_04885 [Nonomuraea terrae]|uniref:Uncharacterized protein n=1 Tax=Nonomuraea terrae TaxID=2530383 RepID=A0A4R4Z8G6_9ACTN|nr:hypothetical protein [Nonomuraea terrae]TDD54528.1 hypothetical protein E1286_04885 [Nonomuraea terrae]